MPRILMIAYHFPPMAASSGIQRTLRFVQHLPAFGWEPLVLSAAPRAYEVTGMDLMADVPTNVVVRRAFALDTARHLSLGGHYPGFLARPDRWMSWQFAAVREGQRLIERYKPDILWSTYPIATAHLIGARLQRWSGLPWVADFRDPMVQPEHDYPADPLTRQSFQQIEEEALRRACFSVFTTPGAAREYRRRYPEAGNRIVVVENGFDEESFSSGASTGNAPGSATGGERLTPGAITLLHSGIVYPSERDPTALFVALRSLREAGRLNIGELLVRFRATAHDEILRALAAKHGVGDFIEFCPSLPYRQALAEMQRADALLVIQSANCNAQIPAKIYEYLRAGRPILGLTDPEGDTAAVMRDAGLDAIVRPDSAEDIAALLPDFLESLRQQRAILPDPGAVARASRLGRTASLALLLDRALKT